MRDGWFEPLVEPRLSGRVFMVRKACTAVSAFATAEVAGPVLVVLAKRLARHGRHLHPDKARLVDVRCSSKGNGGGFDVPGVRPLKARAAPRHTAS